MDTNRVISGIAFIIIFALTLFASSNGVQWRCDNPMISSYLYIILAYVSIWMFSANITTMYSSGIIVSMIGVFILLFALLFTPAQYFWTKHLIFLAYLFCFAYILKPSLDNSPNLVQNIIFASGLFITLTIFSNIFMDKINMSWEKYLLMILVGMIIIYIYGAFTGGFSQQNIRRLAILGVVVFSMFILVDTKRLRMTDCLENPDYINNIMGLFLDGLNLFSNIQTINQ